MHTKKKLNRNWPMNLILGGVLLTACAVLLVHGLQNGEPESGRRSTTLVREPVAAELPSLDADEAHAPAETAEAAAPAPTAAPEAMALAMLTQTMPTRPEPLGADEGDASVDLDPADAEPSFVNGEEAFRAADYHLAARRFTRYSEVHPDNPWGHYMLGLSQWRAGRLDEAEAALGRSLELKADFAKARRNLARVLMSGTRHEEALAILQAAGEADLALSEHQRLLGRALHNLDRPGEALSAYATALAADPADGWALNNLGLILVEGERFEDALSALALAVDLDPDNAIFLNNLGVALEREGHGAQAAEAFRRTLELDAEHDRARASLARVEAFDSGDEAVLDLNTLVAFTADELEAGRFPWSLEPAVRTDATDAADETLISQIP